MRLFLPLLILIVVLGSASVSIAYGAEITYRSPIANWYSYDCTNPSPNVFTKEPPPGASQFKYFGFTTGSKCYATLLNYDVSGLTTISNTTALDFTVDSRSFIIDHPTLSNGYLPTCELYHFNHPDLLAGAIIQIPDVYKSSFICVNANSTAHEQVIILNSTEINNFQSNILGGNTTFSLMVFPQFNATMLSSISSNHFQYGLEKFDNALYVNGNGFNCAIIPGSGMCDFQNHPWTAIGIAFGSEWIGPWFYVIVFFPFPMATYLITRNGTYAGFLGLGIMLAIQTINPMIFQIALTMIFICASFGFYEVIKRRLTA